jgi:hypothetical protein
VLFLNEFGVSAGLNLYDTRASDCLFGLGASRYPSIHPDFISKSGDLNINVTSKCREVQCEFIPSQMNRLVVIRTKSPMQLVTSPVSQFQHNGQHELEVEILLAVVVVFSQNP